MAWTFAYQFLPGGTPEEHSLVWWGISEPTLTFSHATGDEAHFNVIDEDAFASAPLLIPGATGLEHRVWFSQDGTVRFVGVITENPRSSTGSGETRSFVVKGVGNLLSRIIYHQSRLAGVSPDYELVTRQDSHVWLGQDPTGLLLDTGEQMAAILTYAAAVATLDGHEFQHSVTNFPAVNFLLDEGIGLTCEQALLKMLAFSPDYVAWWDYSTLDIYNLPKPTFRCVSRSTMATFAISRNLGQLEASPRYELMTRVVCITYESTAQVDDESRVSVVQDIYPATLNGSPTTGREIGALAVTVPLQGSRTQNLTAAITCETIQAAHASAGTRIPWWLANNPSLRKEANIIEDPSTYTGASGAAATYSGAGAATLAVVLGETYFWEKGANDTNLVNGASTYTSSQEFVALGSTVTINGTVSAEITAFVGRVAIAAADVRRTGAAAYTNRLMPGSGGIAPWMSFNSQEERFTVRAFVTDKTGGHYVDLAVNLTSTDGVTGTYGTTLLIDAGEAVPSGLAEALYGSLSVLQWQGSFKLVEQDVLFFLKLGTVLNISNAETALATGRLMIWRVTVDVFNGTTTAEFGDPENLGIGDMVDRLRALRLRTLYTLPAVQSTGLANGSGSSNLPSVTPRSETTAKTHERTSFAMTSPDPASTQVVNAALSQLPVGSTAQFRQFTICVSGVNRTAYFLATAPV